MGTTAYTFNTIKTAPTLLLMRATDADGISSLRIPATGTVEGQNQIRSGQIRIMNAYGSPLVPLPVTVWLQYWNGTNWMYATTDQTSSFNSAIASTGNVVASNPQQNISSVSTLSPTATYFLKGNGLSGFSLNAPGTGKNGSIDLRINSPVWLNSVTGRATFGTYTGSPAVIYLRELY